MLLQELSDEACELVGAAVLDILLLGAYDKGQDVSKKRQQREITPTHPDAPADARGRGLRTRINSHGAPPFSLPRR